MEAYTKKREQRSKGPEGQIRLDFQNPYDALLLAAQLTEAACDRINSGEPGEMLFRFKDLELGEIEVT